MKGTLSHIHMRGITHSRVRPFKTARMRSTPRGVRLYAFILALLLMAAVIYLLTHMPLSVENGIWPLWS